MDDRIFLAFLLRAEKNLVGFATYTHYTGFVDEDFQLRAASALPSADSDKILKLIDRDATRITDWSSLYRWLGRDVGTWAAFSEDSIGDFFPHWFSADAKYLCRSVSADGNGPFLDVRYGPVAKADLDHFRDLTGAVDSKDGSAYVHNIYSNLAITKRPIFDLEFDVRGQDFFPCPEVAGGRTKG